MINWLINLIKKIGNLGTDSAKSHQGIFRIRLTNYYLLISIASVTLYNILYMLLDFRSLFQVINYTSGFIPLFIIAIYFNKNGYHKVARWIFSTGITGSVFIATAIFFGNTSYLQYFFLLFAVSTVIVWSEKDWGVIAFFLFLNLGCFIYINFLIDNKSAIYQFPQHLATIMGIISIISTFITIVFLIFLFQHQVRSREKTLIDQAKDLSDKNVRLDLQREDIKELYDQIREKNHQIRERNTQLSASNAAKDKFFNILSHDMINPTGAIYKSLELLHDEYGHFSEQDRRDMLSLLKQSSKTLFGLLEGLLIWSRIQTGNFESNPEQILLRDMADAVVALNAFTAGRKKIEIKNLIDNSLYGYSDYNMLSTIVRNLVGNAVKFTQTNGLIELSAKDTLDGFLEITVKDNGLGMSRDRLDRMFNISENTSTPGTERETGTGLGLILIKEFIDQMGCKIWAESTEGKGSTFHFTVLKFNPESV